MKYTSVTNIKFRRKLFSHLLFRVRKRRSQSVLPGRFSILKSCLLWVPQCICLGSFKACSINLSWGRPRPETQKLAVEKDIHHLQDLYTCHSFALLLQRQPYQGYKQTGINPTRSKGVYYRYIPQELLTNSPWIERQTVWSLLMGPVEVWWF